jgi:hypothetical protein
MLGKIHKDNKTPKEQQLDVCFVLDLIKQSKWDNILFQRRFVHILIQWVKLIPKSKFLAYFGIILENLQNTTDQVLIYEQATCVHEMLKEIDYWLKMRGNNTTQSNGSFSTLMNSVGSSASISSLRKTATCDLLDFDG